ncbi:MAG: bifunctional [glutamate--ammonia ligase]-adenylyl-L-tyrosine phosphorylase/[glutamate--ammonia-ligase] adenylyltransferase [Proteobacteria bacterium]|nr:bifunctional [glutamate--ammonia ligase]-adenylyl-L-tyrosine phosphorylase/[glutamate--ammonia-ligase] adenylyltransferase [Pseudomonadota bacterium]MBU4469512.1 bifunctional [glutamate--ammonia ligase]-adenylyl-L-tyrosine phosphorylase/[glutamate--ammonia-ligase] adenylyltransferase [Pseudomonadota bacterium]MCG2753394.1 bifunctional [glutamate--ammonia ligase]-adenylyl-L-tyrosine phosphorylase/[glutamate--ammonia-ligase] adenylyltransferase [Desulfobacteraceae bacterium]
MNLSKNLLLDLEARYGDFLEASSGQSIRLPEDEGFIESLRRVFAFSDFVARNCIRYPGILEDLAHTGDLFNPYSEDGYSLKIQDMASTIRDEGGLKFSLRMFRKREMIRVVWRDLCGWADLSETMRDLSRFAEASMDHALAFLYERQILEFGRPMSPKGRAQQMVVIGMGKLGAGELNFSSDVDLVFAYPENGETEGSAKQVSNEEFFTRLARDLIRVLGASSEEGNLFRVDMRLRPYGENGPLVMSFDNMETYYQVQGRDWERYAWVRARCVAGDQTAGKELMDKIRPFVYRRYLDYTVIDSLREMKAAIALEVKRKKMAENVKLGPGGIREIEFFCQMFQILRGGTLDALQGADTLTVLRFLSSEKLVVGDICAELTKVYEFLRQTEHHLQEFSDAQVHTLPSDALNRERLALSMGFDDYPSFYEALHLKMKAAHEQFGHLLESPEAQKKENAQQQKIKDIWLSLPLQENALEVLTGCGYDKPEDALSALIDLKEASETRALSPKGRQRLDLLMPRVIEDVGAQSESNLILQRIVDLIRVIERRTSYIALMLENPSVVPHLMRLAAASPWIISFLSRYPALLDELIDPRTLYSPPQKAELLKDIQEQFSGLPSNDLERQMETLCIFKQTNVLRVAAADVTGAVPLMKVSDHLTFIAETVLQAALGLCWNQLVRKHGFPSGCSGESLENSGFLVVGYGKLGGLEMGYHSDLDLVFLYIGSEGKTAGPSSIENTYFYGRLGQRLVHMLTAHTGAGVIYDTDMRLRPSGNSGPLVSEMEGFEDYQLQKAWTWEHQSLVRARPICGDPVLADRFSSIRKKALSVPRDKESLKEEIISMRNRIREERFRPVPDGFDLKEEQGGIIDIEFLVQFLVLSHGFKHEALLEWTDNVRAIEALNKHHILSNQTAEILRSSYLTLRSEIHRLNLQEKPSIAPSNRFKDVQADVIKIWKAYLE